MASAKQKKAATANVKKAQKAAAGKKTIASLAESDEGRAREAGRRGRPAASAPAAPTPKTRAELYEIARQRDLPGRSKMGRDELARRLGTS